MRTRFLFILFLIGFGQWGFPGIAHAQCTDSLIYFLVDTSYVTVKTPRDKASPAKRIKQRFIVLLLNLHDGGAIIDEIDALTRKAIRTNDYDAFNEYRSGSRKSTVGTSGWRFVCFSDEFLERLAIKAVYKSTVKSKSGRVCHVFGVLPASMFQYPR